MRSLSKALYKALREFYKEPLAEFRAKLFSKAFWQSLLVKPLT